MTHDQASSNTPIDDNRTLGDLLIALDGADISELLRSKLRSAVLSTARLLEAHLEDIPAKLRVTLARLHQIHPAAEAGVTRKRMQNLRADLKRAFKAVGWVEGQNKKCFTPAWAALFARLESKFDRCSQTRFFRFCSERGIEPDAVDDSVLAAYRLWLETEDAFARDPATLLRDLTRVWNRYAETTEGWPPTRLTLPRSERYWSLSWDRFPKTLRADTEAWLQLQAGDDPLDDFAPPKPLRPATLTARRQQVRMWASALVARGRDPATLATLADLVTVDAFKEALRYLIDAEKGHGKTQPAALAMALLGAARHFVRAPTAHLAELSRLVARVRPPRQGLTERNRSILRQIDNPARRHDLLTFPQTVLAEVRRLPEITYRGAIRLQIALVHLGGSGDA